MQLIFTYSFLCHQQTKPKAHPGTFTFCISACYIHFKWFQIALCKMTSKTTLQTNKGLKPGSFLAEVCLNSITYQCSSVQPGCTWAAGFSTALASSLLGQQEIKQIRYQTKTRLLTSLEPGRQTFLKQEHRAASWRALDVFFPKASFITSCCFISCLLSWTDFSWGNSIVKD